MQGVPRGRRGRTDTATLPIRRVRRPSRPLQRIGHGAPRVDIVGAAGLGQFQDHFMAVPPEFVALGYLVDETFRSRGRPSRLPCR